MSNPFSFTEILQIPSFELKSPAYVLASDGCKLAYYLYAPKEPRAVCILYHGAGFYGNAVHQLIGKELANKHGIATFVVDIRGHGNSGGSRGDAPSIEMVWKDVSVFIDQALEKFPGTPVYLAGHSSGAGLLLNYAAWSKHKKVDGLLLLAPYLGPMAGVQKEYADPNLQFAKKLRSWVYIIGSISRGYLGAHIPAVYFNYPFERLNDDKILECYTYAMSAATTPFAINEIIRIIQEPTS